MASGTFVTYYRVSTQRQGTSGLGLEAQRESVRQYLNGGDWEVVGEFTETESGRKSDQQRPQLAAALAECKRLGARLLVAKLDRLARNVHFVSGLMQAGVKFEAVDLPQANDLTLHIMAAFAEHEAKRISQRTRDAIAAKRARVEAGVDKSGKTAWADAWGTAGRANLRPNIEQRQQGADAFAEKLKGCIEGMQTRGLSQRAMVAELNALGVKTPTGKAWSLTQLQRTITRITSNQGSQGSNPDLSSATPPQSVTTQ